MHILIVDDNRDTLRSYKRALSRRLRLPDLTIGEADTFPLCLAKLQNANAPVEVLVVDLRIPGPNGEEMGGLQIIRDSIALDPLRPIIVITGYGSIELARNTLTQGVFDFIEKGATAINKLIEAVQRTIRNRDEKVVLSGNPFTFVTGIPPTIFGGRQQELQFLDDKFNRAMNSRFCEPFLVMGDWGIGKSTLLKKYKEILQSKGHIAAIVPLEALQTGTKLPEAARSIVEGMLRDLPYSVEHLKQLTKFFSSIGISFAGFGLQMKPSDASKDLPPQAFLHDTLRNLSQDLKEYSDVFVLLLDDLDNFRAVPEILQTLRQTLQFDSLRDAKILVGIAATPACWQQMTTHEQDGNTTHHPLNRFFVQRLHLQPLNQQEVSETIVKSLAGTGVSFSPEITTRVFEITAGHPYEMQVLCYHLFDNQLSRRVEIGVWDKSLECALRDLGFAIFDSWFSQASSEETKVLRVIAEAEESISAKDIQSTLTKQSAGVSSANLGNYLKRLCAKNLVCKTGRGSYAIPDGMFRSYVRLRQD